MTTKPTHFIACSACLVLLLQGSGAQPNDNKRNLRGKVDIAKVQDTEPRERSLADLYFVATDVANGSLGLCQGNCDEDENCASGLVCFRRDGNTPVPGCGGNFNAHPDTDYCIQKQDHPDFHRNLLELCQGDCDSDADCTGNMVCFERTPGQFMAQCPNSVNDHSLTDYCVNPVNAVSGTRSGVNLPGSTNTPRVVSSSTKWQYRGEFDVAKPTDMRVGDLLLLFLSRTDDELPIARSGWQSVASCYKDDNSDRTCALHTECVDRDGDYCTTFRGNRSGQDLATIVFAKPVSRDDVDDWNLSVRLRNRPSRSHPGWAVLAVVRDADLSDPVRSFSTTSCDAVRQTIFPSVPRSQPGDLLLLSMAFDDRVTQDDFQPPPGTAWAGFVNGSDETGILYQKTSLGGGATPVLTTAGNGGRGLCKDATISMVIRPH